MTATEPTNDAVSDEQLREDEIKAAMIAGWNACRKSIYAVCEDAQSEGEKHRSDTENEPRHHFGRGYLTAAKSIARGFNALEAMDDDNLLAALNRRSVTSQASEGAGPVENLHIIFDGPPSHESGRFVEVENDAGYSIQPGKWVERPDGCWDLVIPPASPSKRVERLETADIERLARSAAVSAVDAIHGYTMEFASSPANHRDEYDQAESAIRYELTRVLGAPS